MSASPDMARDGSKPAAATVPRRNRRRGRWVVPVLIGGAVPLGAFAVLHVPIDSPPPSRPQRPSIEWVVPPPASTDSILAEQLLYFDHAPLFLPTPWNYAGDTEQTAIEQSPSDIFEPYPDRLPFEGQSMPAGSVQLPAGSSPLETLAGFSWPYFDAFGRVDGATTPLEPRLAVVEVRSVRTGELVHVETVPDDRVDTDVSWPDWRPFDLFVSITAEDGVAMPMSGGGSGGLAGGNATPEVVADFFRRFLRRESRLELYLPAGFYRVTVGP